MSSAPKGMLLDVDGVLVASWEPLPGAVETVAWLRERGVPFRLLTNTTVLSQEGLCDLLRDAGFDVRADELITAVVATDLYLREHHTDHRALFLGADAVRNDLGGVVFVTEPPFDVVVIGDAEEDPTGEQLNTAFRALMDGAAFVAMHRNLYWQTAEGLTLDVGAYIAALEAASGITASVMGKPSRACYLAAVRSLGLAPHEVAMAGDDVANDALAAEAAGLIGVLVKTGKFRPQDLERCEPTTRVVESVADLRGLFP